MFGLYQNISYRTPLKNANFISVYLYYCVCVSCRQRLIYQNQEKFDMGQCRRCNSCLLTTKCVTSTNYYDTALKLHLPILKSNINRKAKIVSRNIWMVRNHYFIVSGSKFVESSFEPLKQGSIFSPRWSLQF